MEKPVHDCKNAVHGLPISLSEKKSGLRSCIDSKVANRLDGDRNAGQSRGDDANQSALRSGVIACRRCRGFVAIRRPRLHGGRSAAALHARRAAALFIGDTRCRADHRLHAAAARQSERGMPQCFRQARAIRIGGQVERDALSPTVVIAIEAKQSMPPQAEEWIASSPRSSQ